jgi:hypothetical protein
MVEKDQELLKFVKDNRLWKILLKSDFPEQYYKEAKKKYFSGILKNKIGNPRDPEIAKTALDYFLRTGFIKNKTNLDDVLQKPFFSKNIFDSEIYFQKLEITQQESELDFNSIKKQDYNIPKLEEDKEGSGNESEQEINQTNNETTAVESVPSEPDQQADITEPLVVEDTIESRFDPWWKRLGFVSSPFPDTDGLGTINRSLYEHIVVMTEVFGKYIHYIKNVPSELFKNTVFYGEFGVGKTTLFQYLQVPLLKNNIHSTIIRHSAEQDYQNFQMKFKEKMCKDLIKIYEHITGTNIAANIEPLPLDDRIIKTIRSIENTGKCNGFVIFIDDIYKPESFEKIALMFLSQLQVFTAELKKQMASPNLGFFISAPLPWELTLKGNQAYSGSVTLEEHIPLPTVEEARTMFNDRLAAFAITKEKSGHIELGFAQQVQRTLMSRKEPFTFRNFIKECLRRFESGDFGILTANPVLIDKTTLRKIYQILKRNLTLSDGINEILDYSMSVTNKGECLQLLVQIFIQKNINEDSELFQEKISYFQVLAKAGLITRNEEFGKKSSWSVSKELVEFNAVIYREFGYSLDDYFLKLFQGRLALKIDKPTSEKNGPMLIEKLIADLRNRDDDTSSSVGSFLDVALQHHNEVDSYINNMLTNRVSFNKFKDECMASIGSISNAVATHVGMPANRIDFWKDFWYYPDSLVNLKQVLDAESSNVEQSNIYLYAAYSGAFSDIVRFLSEQIDKNNIMPIPAIGLKMEEIRDLDKARDDYRLAKYTSAARRISGLVENKLREFIYSVFILQYGDSRQRMNRIPKNFHYDLQKHIDKDKQCGFPISKNELTYLNRQHYFDILVARDGIGYENWQNSFSKILVGWDIGQMRSYLKMFYQCNLQSAHNKEEVFTAKDQSVIYQYITDSIRLLVTINKSYFTFLEKVKKAQLSGSTQMEYYFTLDENRYSVQPVHVSDENRKRIINLFKESINTIDLSSPCFLEERYGVSYRELFAILADLLKESTDGLETKVIKKNEPIITLKVK